MLLMMSEDKINLELLGARVATANDRLQDLDLLCVPAAPIRS
jgi:hypothetical protein